MPTSVAHCPACGGEDSRPAAPEARFLGLPPGYGLACCSRCGLIYLNPRPTYEEYAAFYTEDAFYDPGHYESIMVGQQGYFLRKWTDLESRLGRKGWALDIGCGPGGFLAAGARRGWRVAGTEISESARRFARDRYGLEVRAATPDDALPFPDARFDAIALNHVLEHLVDPVRCLRACRRVLRADGLLLAEVPYQLHSLKELLRGAAMRATGSWGRGRIYRDKDVPLHHAIYFSPATALLAVRRAGVRPLRIRTFLPGNRCANTGARLGGRWLTELVHYAGSCFRRGPVIEVLAGLSEGPVPCGTSQSRPEAAASSP